MKRALFSMTGILLGAMLSGPACAGPGHKDVVFTHPPTDIANTTGVIPLGNLNPGGRHVLAVNHMYVNYPFPDTGGAYAYPVYAMADGEITMISRQQVPGRPDFDYHIFIRHTDAVTSIFDHVHGLSGRIMAAIAGVPWSGSGGNEGSILFGQPGAPAPLPVAAGEQVGITKSYSFSWDIGVIDTRVRRHFAGHGPRRYPDFDNVKRLFHGGSFEPPYAGNRTLNAACFIDYLEPSLKTAWFDLLVSTPKTCGSDAWDVDGRLRGAWFNPAIDALPLEEALAVDIDSAALSIIPDNRAPLERVQIGVGSNTPYAALNPTGTHSQLFSPLLVNVDFTPGTRVNPDPAAVGPAAGTVCYDFSYNNFGGTRWNTMRFRMLGGRRVAIKYDPTPYAAPHCALQAPLDPDDSWTLYVR